MPGFVSIAQRRHWIQMVDEGKVTQDQFDARESETPQDIPERATPRVHTRGASRSTDAAQIDKTRY